MQVTRYIADLLYRYDCVVISGFGGILTRRKSAHIDLETHTFHPPQKMLSFNRQLRENDGLLARQIAQLEEISYEQSCQKIAVFVQQLHEALESEGKADLPHIGLFYSQGGKVLFQPHYSENYLLDVFGMESFHQSPLIAEEKQQSSATAKVAGKSAPTGETFTKTSPDDKKQYSRPMYWKYAAVGLLAVGLGGFITASWYSQKIQSHNLVAHQKAEQKIEHTIQEATFSINQPLPTVTFKVKRNHGKYHIVAGAYREKENALQKLKQLKAEGFHAQYIGTNKYGLHQVVFESYEDRKEALKSLRKIRKDYSPQAWLLIKSL